MNKKLEHSKKIRQQRGQLLKDALGGECVACGSKDRLQFDHVFPEEKLFSISHRLEYKLESILPELQKCQLLCRFVNADNMLVKDGRCSGSAHGTPSRYTNQACRCRPCKTAWAKYMGPRHANWRRNRTVV